MEIKKCVCGEKPTFMDIDDFENHTKTYIVICYKCGRKKEYTRQIGQIAPKKAISKVISEWNKQH